MKQKEDSPIEVVGDVVLELTRLANMLFLLSNFQDRSITMNAEDVGDTMGVIWGCLDRQIKALDGIQWKPEKGRAAA